MMGRQRFRSFSTHLFKFGVCLCFLGLLPAPALAQENQFGGQDRADAAARMIVLGVQQAIGSLPPTSGQSFTYEFDPELTTFVANERLGPTAFRAAETLGGGRFSLRLAASYFELAETFDPVTYSIDFDDRFPEYPEGFAKLGLSANAKVGLINLAAGYGITDRIEVNLNLPLVIVDAEASQTFSTRTTALGTLPREAPLSGADTISGLNAALASGDLVIREETFRDLGFDFNDGTDFGVGRISLGAKGVLYAGRYAQLALASELFLPSPHEKEFAGPESVAVLPRLIGVIPVTEFLRFHLDAGYDYDFDEAELRRFVWNAGASVPNKWFSIDFGVGGSEYDVPIRWTPNRARGAEVREKVTGRLKFPASTLSVREGNTVGDTFIDFLGGIKVRLTDNVALSGAVTVPLNNEGFRADALGSIALELQL